MLIECDNCGYSGEAELFQPVGNVMCCGPLTFRKCPHCQQMVICDRQEMREQAEEYAREVSAQVEASIGEKDYERARELVKELGMLAQCLNHEGLSTYVRETRRRINRLSQAASL